MYGAFYFAQMAHKPGLTSLTEQSTGAESLMSLYLYCDSAVHLYMIDTKMITRPLLIVFLVLSCCNMANGIVKRLYLGTLMKIFLKIPTT